MDDEQERVLVASDDSILCKAISGRLSTLGYSVIVVFDGEAAIAASKREHLSLVICVTRYPEIHSDGKGGALCLNC